jgi:hypothetical protein
MPWLGVSAHHCCQLNLRKLALQTLLRMPEVIRLLHMQPKRWRGCPVVTEVAYFTITEQSCLNFSNANGARVFPLKYIQLTNLINFDLSKI